MLRVQETLTCLSLCVSLPLYFYNTLKLTQAMTQDKFKTMHNVFDNFTNLTVFKLISQGHFDGLESPVSIGKEANISTARRGEEKVMRKISRLEPATSTACTTTSG